MLLPRRRRAASGGTGVERWSVELSRRAVRGGGGGVCMYVLRRACGQGTHYGVRVWRVQGGADGGTRCHRARFKGTPDV